MEGLPGQTAASIAEIVFGTPGSACDRLSRPPGEPLLACDTVDARYPLADIVKAMGGDLHTIEQLIREHTLYPYLRLAYSDAVAADFLARLITGIGTARQPNLAVWAARDPQPSLRVCRVCEALAWACPGIRPVFCQHQMPFVTVCGDHEIAVTWRRPGAAPPRLQPSRPATVAELAFARASVVIWKAGSDPAGLREQLDHTLFRRDFARSSGAYRVRALGAALSAFCRENIHDVRLRRLATSPLRARDLCQWIAGRRATLHPVYLVLLQMFLDGSTGDTP
ncbi:hypothetical protein [Cupriavidus basilensis]|uniref:hypothetical protein n=1 Tax=Cupriavidus basilensis TaxID=68895 RepID=UPI00157ACB80|nr:hypothetical protein [Cupriavidus basilensis]NUA30266.1 hypothetical protein [Cupriavidus basilensis]